ncbi:MAG: hypothetical protein WC615_11560 [Mucilaginibacter sp.]|jgi:hypothetical protein|uniref:hypothetical protein n=1 Tax=Mucilaginibacter sp. TaxID=1882438 RepID=UPI0035632CCF
MRKKIAIILLCFFASCINPNIKTLDLKNFSISVPKDWNYNQAKGVDSFVGDIEGPGITLSFDFSTMGFANHLSDLEHESQNVKVDSSGEYIIKTIRPKIAGKGITGIYIQSRKSSLNFQMNGRDLAELQQEQALTAFNTIKIKQKGNGDPLPFK